MPRFAGPLSSTWLVLAVVLDCDPSAAQSQPARTVPCPDGRLSSDKCANASVSEALRKGTVSGTQRKLSPAGSPVEQKNQKLSPPER